MQFTRDSITSILFPEHLMDELVELCRHKLSDTHGGSECSDKKVFGLIAGTIDKSHLIIEAIEPLLKNARAMECQKPYMDDMMEKHAIPSETPLDQRGWVADPQELQDVLKKFRAKNLQLVGSYHMHRVAWQHDQIRDTPTELDMILGEGSRMFMFIISMVQPKAPVIRAFFEGDCDLEVPIIPK